MSSSAIYKIKADISIRDLLNIYSSCNYLGFLKFLNCKPRYLSALLGAPLPSCYLPPSHPLHASLQWHLKNRLPPLSEACSFTVGLLIWTNLKMSGCINTQGKICFIKAPVLENYMLLSECFATFKSVIIPFPLMSDTAYVYTCFSWLMTVHREARCALGGNII